MAPKTDLCLVLSSKLDLALEEKPLDDSELAEGYAVVQIRSVGICGTDVHLWQDGRIGSIAVEKPLVLGHEASGIVSAINNSKKGRGEGHISVGDRVAIEGSYYCNVCEHCKSGRFNMCLNRLFVGLPPEDGCLRRFYRLPLHILHKIPDNLTYEHGVLVEPLSVAIHAVDRVGGGGLDLGSRVLILGSGCIGVCNFVYARSRGVSDILMVDVMRHKLDTIKDMFGLDEDYVLCIGRNDTVKDIVANIGNKFKVIANKYTAHKNDNSNDDSSSGSLTISTPFPAVTIECSGVPKCMEVAVEATKRGGSIIALGINGGETTNLDVNKVITKELRLLGSFRYMYSSYSKCMNMLSRDEELKKNILKLITHRFKFEDSIKAFETARDSATNGASKIMISID